MSTTLHTLFETEYPELALAIDKIAECIRSLGAYVPASFTLFSQPNAVKELGPRR